MGAQAVEKAKFTDYPIEMDEYIKSKNAFIKPLPDRYKNLIEKKCSPIKITSVKQFVTFLNQEAVFWSKLKGEGKDYLGCLDLITNTLKYLESAKDAYVKNDRYNKERYLNNAISFVSSNYICSKTDLAKYIAKLNNKSKYFFYGFDAGLQDVESQQFNYYNYTVSIEGLLEGVNYRNVNKSAVERYQEVLVDCSENIKEATENFSKLNNDYTVAYREQERRIEEIQEKTNAEIKNLKDESEKYLTEKKNDFEGLERLYAEKLKLSEPAEYWKSMSKSYQKQGAGWLIGSVVASFIIVGMLIAIIICAPSAFGDDTHIFDIVKNSAIITVIASVMIYLLRTFIKMAMSSLHLSRDAKEREQLSYFYLALIAKNAVSEKEQALVINALFSRSDTGLLKGDASPSMSANVGEIVDKITKK